MTNLIPNAARHVDQHYKVGAKHFDDSFSPEAGRLRLARHSTKFGQWQQGDYVDYRGIVTIQMEATYLRIDAVANGRWHIRTWSRWFGERTIAKLCRAFLTELHGEPK